MIKIKRLTNTSKLPSVANCNDAGLDLCADTNADLLPGTIASIPTGLAFALPVGTVGLIWPRSKLASKWGLDTLAGVIDSGYRGEVMVSVINHGHRIIEIRRGDKIAQMVIQEHRTGDSIEEVRELDETARGASGINDSELRL